MSIEQEINNPDKVYVLADVLRRKISEYYKVAENRKKFEEWYEKEYGEKYVWRS